MRQSSTLATAVSVVLLLVLAVDARQQEPRRPIAPMLTSEDVMSPAAAPLLPEASVSRTNLSGSPLRNPRTVLESALAKMGEVNSLRTRLQTSLPDGQKEILIESVKPDRIHVITPYGEAISIGRKVYVKGANGWEVSSMAAGDAQTDAGFDFRALVKQMIGKSSVRITGQVLGGQLIDGVDTVAYEFVLTDGAETGTLQLNVGKGDGYMRRMSLSGGALSLKLWFTNINEHLSIVPPM